jgi:acyl-CoA dehydrogenase-like protein
MDGAACSRRTSSTTAWSGRFTPGGALAWLPSGTAMGNHGYVHTNRAEMGYRDARLTQIYEGTNQINRLGIIEDQMVDLLSRMSESEE